MYASFGGLLTAEGVTSHFSCEFTDDEFEPVVQNFQPIFEQITPVIPLLNWKGRINTTGGQGCLWENFGLNLKVGFSGVRWHIDNSILWSIGCMILGSQYLEGRATPDIYKVHPSYVIPIHIFNPNDSLLKSEELSKFACCIKCKLKKYHSVKAVYKS